MKIAELTLNVDEKGVVKIPAEMILEMGAKPGEAINVLYYTKDGMENSFHELMVYSNRMSAPGEVAQHTIQIPSELMRQSNLTEDEDLQIVCLDGAILICRDTAMNTAELEALLEQLAMTNDLAAALPDTVEQVQEQLIRMIEEYEGGDI